MSPSIAKCPQTIPLWRTTGGIEKPTSAGPAQRGLGKGTRLLLDGLKVPSISDSRRLLGSCPPSTHQLASLQESSPVSTLGFRWDQLPGRRPGKITLQQAHRDAAKPKEMRHVCGRLSFLVAHSPWRDRPRGPRWGNKGIS